MVDVLDSLENGTSEATIAEVKNKVLALCKNSLCTLRNKIILNSLLN